MDTLESMRVFTRVAQRAGFAAAARELRMSPAAVTKHVAALEARVGARLLDRTTRSVALTEAGRVYLDLCFATLQAAEDADTAMSELMHEPKGLVRVTAPFDLQTKLPAVASQFMRAYPGVTIELRLSNRTVDLVEEGVDLAIRVAPALDSRYVARVLATPRLSIVAAPAFWREHGRPRKPEELAKLRAIVFVEPRPYDELTFVRDDKRTTVKLRAGLFTNSGEAARVAALEAAALLMAPSFVIGDDLARGTLEPVLEDWQLQPQLRVWALYPHRRFLAPSVRALIETLRECWGDGTRDPWWPARASAVATPRGGPSAARRTPRDARR